MQAPPGQAKGMSAYQAAVHSSSNIQGGQVLAPPGLHHLQMAQQHRPGAVLPMPGGSTMLPQQRPGGFNTGQMVPGQLVQGTQLLSHKLQSGQLIQPGNPGPIIGNPAMGQLSSSFSRGSGSQLLPEPSNLNSNRVQSQAGVPVSGLAQQQVLSSGHILLPTHGQGQHVTDSAAQAVQTRGTHVDSNRRNTIPQGAVSNSRTVVAQPEGSSEHKLSQEQGLQWSIEVEEEERIARLEQGPAVAQQAGEISNKASGVISQGTSQSSEEPLVMGEWETVKPYGRVGNKKTMSSERPVESKTREDRIQRLPTSVQSQGGSASGVPGVLPVPGHLRRDQATSVSGLTQSPEDNSVQPQGHHGGGGGVGRTIGGKETRSSETLLPHTAEDLAR